MPAKSFRKIKHIMMRLMARIMPSCRDITRDISAGMDRDLPLRKRLSIRLHLSMCKFCRRYERQLHLLREGVRHYADPDVNATDTALSPEARARLKKTLADRAK